MKKCLILLVATCLSLFFVACSADKQASKTEEKIQAQKIIQQEPKSATVQFISQTNLEHWKISLSPNLEYHTEYLGDYPAMKPKLQLKTGETINFLISTPKIKPHSKGFTGEGLKDMYIGKVEIDLSWQQNGKEINGKAIYQIKPL